MSAPQIDDDREMIPGDTVWWQDPEGIDSGFYELQQVSLRTAVIWSERSGAFECTLIDISMEAPRPTSMSPEEALSALRDAQRTYGKDTKVSEVYDSDETVSAALNVVFTDFEYPDHSWKTLEAVTRQAIARVAPGATPAKRTTSSPSM